MSAECRTNCPIPAGGYCPRHGLKKSAKHVHLCVTRDEYFEQWEAGGGPGRLKHDHAPTERVWDCPVCDTRHIIAPLGERICICGTVRKSNGDIIYATEGDQMLDVDIKDYNRSSTGRVLRWGRAIGRWLLAGRPKREQAEIARLWEICRVCEFVNADRTACTICGCRVSLTGSPLFNKLAMATEECPKNKWSACVACGLSPQGGCGGARREASAPTWSLDEVAKITARGERRRVVRGRASRRKNRGQ